MLHKQFETNGIDQGNRGPEKKIWPFFSHFHEAHEEKKDVIDLMKQFSRPRPLKGTLVELNEQNTLQDNQDADDNESFHRSISTILVFAQIFGLLPVANVKNRSPARLSFKFVSIRTVHTVIVIIMLSFMTGTAILHMVDTLGADTFVKEGGIASATAGAIFYTNGLIGTLLFFWLSPKWMGLQKEWRLMERYLNSCNEPRPRLRWRFTMITSMIMIPAAIEHSLSLTKAFRVTSDFPYDNATWKDYVHLYSYNTHAFTLKYVNFTPLFGIFLFIISKFATFTWNFTDLFIMLIATGLAERYKQLNQVVLAAMSKNHSNLDWRNLREKYAALSSLVKQTDNDVSSIILLSFANNLYFICLQLLNGLGPKTANIVDTLYFFGSFAFLVGRTVAVTLLTARINDQSKIALPVIFTCPASSFTMETQRLQMQLTTDDVVMTGMKFFSITRNFMLAVAGAIVTYEVVLLQFNVAMKA